MDFYVNGNKLDVTLEKEKTVGEVLRSFEITCEQNGMATVGIIVDGKTIEAKQFDEAAMIPLDCNTKIELSVVSEQTISDSFGKYAVIFKELAEQMGLVPVRLQSGKNSEIQKTITELANSVDDFCHTAKLSYLFPEKYAALSIDGKPLNTFFADFSSILTDFARALESKDIVSIGDLAEYEIQPRLSAIACAAQIIAGDGYK